MGSGKEREVEFIEIIGILVGVLYLSFSIGFDKVLYFLMNKMEIWGLREFDCVVLEWFWGLIGLVFVVVSFKGGFWCCVLGFICFILLFMLMCDLVWGF